MFRNQMCIKINKLWLHERKLFFKRGTVTSTRLKSKTNISTNLELELERKDNQSLRNPRLKSKVSVSTKCTSESEQNRKLSKTNQLQHIPNMQDMFAINSISNNEEDKHISQYAQGVLENPLLKMNKYALAGLIYQKKKPNKSILASTTNINQDQND